MGWSGSGLKVEFGLGRRAVRDLVHERMSVVGFGWAGGGQRRGSGWLREPAG